MGAFDIIVLDKGLGVGLRLWQVTRLIDGQAFFLIGAVVALDEAIFLGMLWGTDLNLDAQASTEADEGGGKVAALGTGHPAGIAIHGDQLATAIFGSREGESCQR